MDTKTNIQDLKEKIKNFCDDRNWDDHHHAKDLAIGIVTEAGELLHHFRFKSENQIKNMLKDNDKRKKITEEISDVLYFVLRLAQKYDIDLSTELNKKMDKNAKKYPVKK